MIFMEGGGGGGHLGSMASRWLVVMAMRSCWIVSFMLSYCWYNQYTS